MVKVDLRTVSFDIPPQEVRVSSVVVSAVTQVVQADCLAQLQ